MPAGFAPASTDKMSSLDLHHRLESVPTKTACQEKGSNCLLRPQKLPNPTSLRQQAWAHEGLSKLSRFAGPSAATSGQANFRARRRNPEREARRTSSTLRQQAWAL